MNFSAAFQGSERKKRSERYIFCVRTKKKSQVYIKSKVGLGEILYSWHGPIRNRDLESPTELGAGGNGRGESGIWKKTFFLSPRYITLYPYLPVRSSVSVSPLPTPQRFVPFVFVFLLDFCLKQSSLCGKALQKFSYVGHEYAEAQFSTYMNPNAAQIYLNTMVMYYKTPGC